MASEPRIFWDGNLEEAAEIISRINIPKELGTLEPADPKFNGPSAQTLDDHILKPLGFTRDDVWLCDLLPETRLNKGQQKAIEERYNTQIEKYGLNKVTIPNRPSLFCDNERCKEILKELEESQAGLLVLLGDIPIKQFLNRVASVNYHSLKEYKDIYEYGKSSEVTINGRTIKVLPLAHPRQIGALGGHNKEWFNEHQKWENNGK